MPSSQPLPERLFYNNGPGNRAGRNGMAAATQPARRPRQCASPPSCSAPARACPARSSRSRRKAWSRSSRATVPSPTTKARRAPRARSTNSPAISRIASASASSFHLRARRRPRSPLSPAIARTSRRPGWSQATHLMTACISAPCSSASTSTSSIASRTRCRRRRPTWSGGGSSCCETRRTPRSLARLARETPGLTWTTVKGGDALDLLDRVARGDADVTIADSIEFSLGRHFHPDLRPAFKLEESEAVAWALSPHGGDLLREVERYFADIGTNGRLADILERNRLSLMCASTAWTPRISSRASRERLPLYQSWFREAALESGIDWRLLGGASVTRSRAGTRPRSRRPACRD